MVRVVTVLTRWVGRQRLFRRPLPHQQVAAARPTPAPPRLERPFQVAVPGQARNTQADRWAAQSRNVRDMLLRGPGDAGGICAPTDRHQDPVIGRLQSAVLHSLGWHSGVGLRLEARLRSGFRCAALGHATRSPPGKIGAPAGLPSGCGGSTFRPIAAVQRDDFRRCVAPAGRRSSLVWGHSSRSLTTNEGVQSFLVVENPAAVLGPLWADPLHPPHC